MKKLLTSVLLLILASVSGLTQDKGRAASKIEYSVIEGERGGVFKFAALRATENGKIYQLIDQSKQMCLQIFDQRDFDGNGFVDALVKHIVACGGNGVGDSFFFVSAFGNGRFEVRLSGPVKNRAISAGISRSQ
jgi:hypothetical protein